VINNIKYCRRYHLSNEYNFGQKGVSTDIQFGKRGPRLVANLTTSALQVTTADGQTLNNVRIANAVVDSDAVTKAQLDSELANVSSNAFNITLGNVQADGDGSFTSPGALTTFTNNTSVSDAIDDLNEAMENVRNNTFVKDVDFTSDSTQGGTPLSVTLSITVSGNANQYDVDWGDGTYSNATSDSTPSHTYTDDTNSPFDLTVTARNTNGSGAGAEASTSKTDYITLYTATPVADFEIYDSSSGGTALSGNNRYILQGNTVYLENITTNSSSATCTYTVDWGDGTSIETINSGDAGDVGQSRKNHTYSTNSGSSTFTITLTQTAHSTADPTDVGSTTTEIIKVYALSPSQPDGLSTKTLSFAESSIGTSPKLADGFTNRSTESTLTAGSSVTRITSSSVGSTIDTSTLTTYAFDADSGELEAIADGNAVVGNVTLSIADNSGTYSRTGIFNGLVVTDEEDYQLLSSAGSSTTFSSSTIYPGAYKGFKARMFLTTSGYSSSDGLHTMKLSHSTTGNTNVVEFVLDDLTSTPTVSMSNATITESSAGTLRYVSGIPYYTNDASVTLSNVEVFNWIGQTYADIASPFLVTNGTNQESTTGTTVSSQYFSYSDLTGTVAYLQSGVPVADTGFNSASTYVIGDLTVDVDGGGIGIEQIKARMQNVNGNGSYTELTGKYVQAWNGNISINETAQRNIIKTLSGDAGTYHAGFPTIQRVARGAGADYSTNFLTDAGITFWNLTDLFDNNVHNDMVWYLNSTGDGYGDGELDAQEVIEHVFHTLHMHGLDAVSLKMYPYISADWATGPLYNAMVEAYDGGYWDPAGYGGASFKTDGDAFEVAAKEYLYLLNFCMFEYTDLWDGDSLAPEWADTVRTSSQIQTNLPLGYALFNSYIAPVISKPSLATINSIFGDGNTPAQDNPALAGASGYVVDGSPADAEYNNGAISNVTGDGSDFFKRELTVNGVRIMGAGTVGGQTAVPDAWLEKVGRMFELFLNPAGPGGTFDEPTISVSDSLGATHDDDGVRITGFSSASDTPAFDNSVNNYTANAWSGAETIAGTAEAVDRFGKLVHFATDLSSTAYLPTGPDLATGRSGAQYFTFAFRRSTMANFDITLSGTISGLFIAAPGTDIDDASGLNGWLDAGTTYGGSGTPGSDTSNGGNGSDGCAFTSGDRIVDGTSYSNQSFTMTLGDQNASNSVGNTVLVRIKLESGDSLTALSIS
jgi:hypothetical protein